MLIQTWSQVFLLSLEGLWYGFIAIFPKILLAIIIFIIGWIIASTLGSGLVIGVELRPNGPTPWADGLNRSKFCLPLCGLF